ncbi:MAG: hypothetical protein J0L63_06380 [Anaerolineae bacterium]|nr:hypothetical protein [Anaerolineae bacterium]MBN8618512.1 hypothetical protein [Anaerolineae bacterium]
MFSISGVWDANMKYRMVGFIGILLILLVAYLGALASGVTVFIRFFI